MFIDGPITSQTVDSSGEILHLSGLDISDFTEGRAWLNWEHDNSVSENLIGKFTFAKKIFTEADCDTDRQREFWRQLETPFLYGIAELMDGEDHPGAVACAAMLRYFKKRNEKVLIGFSVEGQTLERADGDLLRTVGRRCAFTLKPCNKQCWIDMLSESGMDMQKNEAGFGSARQVVSMESALFDEISSIDPVQNLKVVFADFKKTLTAGGYNVAPGNLTGGAALQVEDRSMKNKLKAAVRDWDRARPLKEFIKAAMPELSEQYVDHFAHMAHDLMLKKAEYDPSKVVRMGAQHITHANQDDAQKGLAEGLFWNMGEPMKPAHKQFSAHLRKLQNDRGQHAVVKFNDPAMGMNPDTPVHYYRLARDFYGMGDHVPVTTKVRHPNIHDNADLGVHEFVPGGTSYDSKEAYGKAARPAREKGISHKLAIMDMINGMVDRHAGNVVATPKGDLVHIDNDQGVTEMGTEPSAHLDHPEYGIRNDTLHPDAAAWIQKLGTNDLIHRAKKMGIPMETTRAMASRLAMVKHMAQSGMTFHAMIEAMKHRGLMA